ncbi:hypothetical protein PAECIP112173_00581 [Paenibacillus sp. JJ-100]|uniref:hypothetical protein n=1 Tax=Paenibacillus sp. JJ-100 TaxID=2974896 RepID=UPI0022FF98AC|nr:hypothetical protein [Paenibacillus sp. JJ-100]CAI6029532.1 hypothetical protein PAECIP112173_00581 [Paenibacillus sp. JJ-100]
MRKRIPVLLSILFILLLTACSSHSKVYNLEDITQLFEKGDLHLKPQAEDNYPTIKNVKPSVYELLDDILYIYVFESEDKRIEASKGLIVQELFNTPSDINPPLSYIHHMNNVLIIYITSSPLDKNFKKQIDDIITAEQVHK